MYRGRLAPSPTGFLHLGHARTFLVAHQRAREAKGRLVFRNDDLDQARCKNEFFEASLEDLHWLGLNWDEGPYHQSQNLQRYREVLLELVRRELVYPCCCSRKDIAAALTAPHRGDDEIPYPGTCRQGCLPQRKVLSYRFRVPPAAEVAFVDGQCGAQVFREGQDFGDFVVWRPPDRPGAWEIGDGSNFSYQLACVVDDHDHKISEVVRGEDLLASTARQLCLFSALGWEPPQYYHVGLVCDENGKRLAKRHDALSIRQARQSGISPQQYLSSMAQSCEPLV